MPAKSYIYIWRIIIYISLKIKISSSTKILKLKMPFTILYLQHRSISMFILCLCEKYSNKASLTTKNNIICKHSKKINLPEGMANYFSSKTTQLHYIGIDSMWPGISKTPLIDLYAESAQSYFIRGIFNYIYYLCSFANTFAL